MISIIVARAENGVIGAQGDLPWYLPADLKHFKELTTGHAVVMGRKTYDSIVARLGHSLPNRRNIVVSRQNVKYPDAEVVQNLDALNELGDVFVIGGAELYRQMIDRADQMFITEVKTVVPGDVFFPEFDKSKWRESARESHSKDEVNQHNFDFVTYERLNK